MPKPTDSYTWNDNETNEAVPTGGHASDGYANGEIPASNEWNHMFRINGEVSRWVGDGSAAPDEDAHIVETDATGQANVALAVFGPPTTTPDDATLVVYGPADQGVAILAFGSDGGGAGINATGGDSQPGGFFTGGSNGGNGVEGQGVDTGHGVVGSGGEVGSGVVGNCGNNGAAGVEGVGQNGAPGVLGTAPTDGNGVEGDGGANGTAGVVGRAGGTGNFGVYGISGASGTTSAGGVYGVGQGDAPGIRSNAADGHGVVAQSDTTSPARSALHIVPQSADPTTLADGNVWMSSTFTDFRYRINATTRSVWGTPGGQIWGAQTGQTGTNNSAGVYTTLCTVTLSGSGSPLRTGDVMITASAEFGAIGGTIHNDIDIRLRDDTASATVWQQTILHPAAVAGSTYDRPWSIQVRYTLPLVGSRTFYLQFARIGAGGAGIQARDASLVVSGIY
jgi:hypothetical protein